MITIHMSEHGGWSDSIYWSNYKERKLAGHMTPKPEVGDEIVCEMKSPDEARHFKIYKVLKVEDFFDPDDQFFADVIDFGFIIQPKGADEIRFEVGQRCPFCQKKFRKNFQSIDEHVGKKHREVLNFP